MAKTKGKQFRVVARLDDYLSLEETNKTERWQALVKEFITTTDGGEIPASIEVYELTDAGLYKRIHSARYEPTKNAERVIGFGRW